MIHPGPWSITTKHAVYSDDRIILGAGGEFVAETTEDDAALLAVAPELLEACVDTLILFHDVPADKLMAAVQSHNRRLAALVAKARGGR